jgi:hypothetical protein
MSDSENIRSMMDNGFSRFQDVSRTSMLHWWPKIEPLSGVIPMPVTEIVIAPATIMGMLDGESLPEYFCKEIQRVSEKFMRPIFIRTDYVSGKHSWDRSCYLPSGDRLLQHIYELVENSALVDQSVQAIVFREYIEPDPGHMVVDWFDNMPLRKEVRCFIQDGRLVCWHPYWPADAVDTEYCPRPVLREEVARINATITDADIAILTDYCAKVGEVLPGAWSVDFMWSGKRNFWYLIDMAAAALSWHPQCEFKKGRDLGG